MVYPRSTSHICLNIGISVVKDAVNGGPSTRTGVSYNILLDVI